MGLCEDDAEVARLEESSAQARAAFASATRLDQTPLAPKFALLSGTIVLVLSAYLLLLLSPSCFEDFALTDDIAQALCLHCERAAVKPLGWAAFVMLGYALACRQLWQRWADAAVRARTSSSMV